MIEVCPACHAPLGAHWKSGTPCPACGSRTFLKELSAKVSTAASVIKTVQVHKEVSIEPSAWVPQVITPARRPQVPLPPRSRISFVPPVPLPTGEATKGPITRDILAQEVQLTIRALPPSSPDGSHTFSVDGTIVGQGDLNDDAALEIAQVILDKLRDGS